MNKAILTGRLTANPKFQTISTTNGDLEKSQFTIAVDRKRKSPDGANSADFIRIIAFGKLAEWTKEYELGDLVSVIGHIQTGSYNSTDGHKVYTTDIIAEETGIVRKHKVKKLEENNEEVESESFEDISSDDDLPF